jgi:putative sporulation protein YyaC
MKTIYRGSYNDQQLYPELVANLSSLLSGYESKLVVICIGSDRSIPDCLGPLVGTMLEEAGTALPVYGTLEQPVHARNLAAKIGLIKTRYAGFIELAIDASLGRKGEIGQIEIKQGALYPGRALNKDLPPIGNISILGKVGCFQGRYSHENVTSGRLGMIYQMARLIACGIRSWEKEIG